MFLATELLLNRYMRNGSGLSPVFTIPTVLSNPACPSLTRWYSLLTPLATFLELQHQPNPINFPRRRVSSNAWPRGLVTSDLPCLPLVSIISYLMLRVESVHLYKEKSQVTTRQRHYLFRSTKSNHPWTTPCLGFNSSLLTLNRVFKPTQLSTLNQA